MPELPARLRISKFEEVRVLRTTPAHPRALRIATLVAAVLLAGAVTPTAGQTPADSAGVHAASLEYIEGWYEGDAERMARALHSELVKRIHRRDPESERHWLDTQGRSRLVAGTASGGGSRTPAEKRRTEVTVLDIFRGAAAVRIDAGEWIDYLHLVREDGRWQIVNVLWELRAP